MSRFSRCFGCYPPLCRLLPCPSVVPILSLVAKRSLLRERRSSCSPRSSERCEGCGDGKQDIQRNGPAGRKAERVDREEAGKSRRALCIWRTDGERSLGGVKPVGAKKRSDLGGFATRGGSNKWAYIRLRVYVHVTNVDIAVSRSSQASDRQIEEAGI